MVPRAGPVRVHGGREPAAPRDHACHPGRGPRRPGPPARTLRAPGARPAVPPRAGPGGPPRRRPAGRDARPGRGRHHAQLGPADADGGPRVGPGPPGDPHAAGRPRARDAGPGPPPCTGAPRRDRRPGRGHGGRTGTDPAHGQGQRTDRRPGRRHDHARLAHLRPSHAAGRPRSGAQPGPGAEHVLLPRAERVSAVIGPGGRRPLDRAAVLRARLLGRRRPRPAPRTHPRVRARSALPAQRRLRLAAPRLLGDLRAGPLPRRPRRARLLRRARPHHREHLHRPLPEHQPRRLSPPVPSPGARSEGPLHTRRLGSFVWIRPDRGAVPGPASPARPRREARAPRTADAAATVHGR
ncbi:hypothetical protein SGPA1_30336 [Streptomyces misionensis JCM 4497]